MPTYEFECPKCKDTIEIEMSVKNIVNPMCTQENCNIEMEQIISAPAFRLKGVGWAKDGYSNKR